MKLNKRSLEGKEADKKTTKGKRQCRFGIRSRIIITFMIPVILIIALGVISYKKASKGLIKSYEKAAAETMKATGRYFDLGFASAAATAKQLGADKNIDNILAYGSYGEFHKSIVAKAKADDLIRNIHILSKNGVGISTSAGAVRKDLIPDFMDSFEGRKLSKSQEDIIWLGSHPYLDKTMKVYNQNYCMSLLLKASKIANFTEKKDEIQAYIIIDISMEPILVTLEEFDWGRNSLISFITPDGREIAAKQDTEDEKLMFQNQDFYKEALGRDDDSGTIYCSYNGRKYLFVYARMRETGAVVCGLIPQEMILGQAADIKKATYIFIIAAVITAFTAGTVIALDMGNAVKKMLKAFKRISEGDLTAAVTMKRQDEFGLLADGMSDMIYSMRSLLENVTNVNKEVMNSTGEVTAASRILDAETGEIISALTDIDAGIHRQASDTEECLNQMSVLSGKVNNVYENTDQMNQIANDVKESAKDGIIMVEDLSGKITRTVEATQNMINNIKKLDEKTKYIEGIINTMNEIAEQTNLLSLNASIEAARAGAAGRGFQVVATEVRKLADDSVQAAGRIRKLIDEIQAGTRDAVTTAVYARETAASEEASLYDTVRMFYHINGQVEKLAAGIGDVSAKMAGIEHSKKGTLDAMESISAIAEQTAAMSEQIGRSARRQMEAVGNLNNAVNGLDVSAGSLDNAVTIFTI